MRKLTYKYSILKPDYFIIKHLNNFVIKALNDNIFEGAKVADVGCGEQPFKKLILNLNATYTGFDIQQNSQNSIDIISTVENIVAKDETFDIVLCSEVLEHVNNHQVGFSELIRIIKPSGILIITSPFLYPLHEEPYDKQRLTIHNFKALISENNLVTMTNETSGNEMEVIAEIWDNLWIRKGYKNIWQKFRGTFLRIPVNLTVLIISNLFKSSFPKKAYLSNMLILKK